MTRSTNSTGMGAPLAPMAKNSTAWWAANTTGVSKSSRTKSAAFTTASTDCGTPRFERSTYSCPAEWVTTNGGPCSESAISSTAARVRSARSLAAHASTFAVSASVFAVRAASRAARERCSRHQATAAPATAATAAAADTQAAHVCASTPESSQIEEVA